MGKGYEQTVHTQTLKRKRKHLQKFFLGSQRNVNYIVPADLVKKKVDYKKKY